MAASVYLGSLYLELSDSASVLPKLPRCRAAGRQLLQMLAILKGIHARPEAVILVADQLSLCHQSLEGFNHQLFAFAHVVENLLLENEESTIDPNAAIVNRMNVRHQALSSVVHRNKVIAKIWTDAHETSNLVLSMEMI